MLRRMFYPGFKLLIQQGDWVRSRFTPVGRAVFWGLIAAGILGLDTRKADLYQLFALCLLLLVAAMLHAPFFRGRFRLQRHLPPFATIGEPLAYDVDVENLGSRPQQGLLLREASAERFPGYAEFRAAREPGEGRRNLFDRWMGFHRFMWLVKRKRGLLPRGRELPPLPPGERVRVRLETTPTRRGSVQLSGVFLGRSDPLGLFYGLIHLPAPQTLVVLPKRYRLPPIHFLAGRKYQSGGVALAGSVGEAEEFVSLREYRQGDPMRRIHWRSMAKLGEPVVKEYQDEFFVRQGLILDTFSESASETFEEAVAIAASFALGMPDQDSLLDLLFVGDRAYCVTSGRGLAPHDKMLEVLASVVAVSGVPFSTLAAAVLQRVHGLSGAIVVLLSWDQERQALVARLRAARVPVMVLIVRDEGVKDALAPGPMADKPHLFHVLSADRVEEGLLALG